MTTWQIAWIRMILDDGFEPPGRNSDSSELPRSPRVKAPDICLWEEEREKKMTKAQQTPVIQRPLRLEGGDDTL
ncbi:MAG: hypothetical protein R2827_01910 [Bdellovibrionales bacterium]